MTSMNNKTIYFFRFIFIILTGAVYSTLNPEDNKINEAFSNFRYALGEYPTSQDGPILPNSMFPHTNNKVASGCTPQMIWRNYPIFEVGSYKQETNNIRYPRNPDDGRCTPADMCGSLYNNRAYHTNVVDPLPPAKLQVGRTRVNYYNSDTGNMMPYYNKNNILY